MNELIVKGIEQVSIAPSPDAKRMEEELFARASVITREPSSPEEDALIRDLNRDCAQFRIGLEATRKMITAPINALKAKVDSTAQEFGARILAQETKFKVLRASYAEKVERQKQEAARRAAALEAERQRLEEEALRLRDKAEEKEEVAPIAAAKAVAAAVAVEAKVEEVAHQQQGLVAFAESEAPRGVRKVWTFSDENMDLHALYKAFPRLVTLTIKKREVLEELARQAEKGLIPTLPGLEVHLETKVSSR